MTDDRIWIGTWTTSPVPVDEISFGNQTLRMIARASIGGRTLRVRISNAYGDARLVLGEARIALAQSDARILPGSDCRLSFAGGGSAVIAAGAQLLSDPVDLEFPPLSDLAVSLYLPDELAENFRITGHGNAHQTNYISEPGNFAAAGALPVSVTTDSWLFLAGIDVEAASETAGVVTFGDSLTDGNLSSLDSNCRWPDQLARRLVERADEQLGGRPATVMNQGIGGNRILHDLRGDSGLRRLDRDVLAQPGATHAIVLLGINDIRNRRGLPEEVISADEMIAGLAQIAARARVQGLKIFGGTLLPFENETFFPGAYNAANEAKRQAVNAWIRTGRAFDAVIDFDAALRDPGHPASLLTQYDCGDHLHPSDLGYQAMGDAIDLALFD